MKKIYFGVYYIANEGADPVLCEVDGGICYEAYTDIADANSSASEANDSAIAHGWHGRYDVRIIPAGVRVWDRDSDCESIASGDGRMKTKSTPFRAVPVGGFFYVDMLGWLVKTSTRHGRLGYKGRIDLYVFPMSYVVMVLI